MTTGLIDGNIVEANRFVDYTRNTIIENKKMNFEEACAECNAVSVDFFIEELQKKVKERYRNAKS